jgi:GntR family transcriptional regulator
VEEVDLMGPEPLYQQIARILRGRIADGTYEPDRRIPSENELSRMFSVSRPTARSALQLLIKEKLVIPVRGKGTFVRPPAEDKTEDTPSAS